jgi:hypothetical protein
MLPALWRNCGKFDRLPRLLGPWQYSDVRLIAAFAKGPDSLTLELKEKNGRDRGADELLYRELRCTGLFWLLLPFVGRLFLLRARITLPARFLVFLDGSVGVLVWSEVAALVTSCTLVATPSVSVETLSAKS